MGTEWNEMNSAECLLRLVLALLPSLERTDSWSTDTWRMFWSSGLECLLACDAVFLLRGIPANGPRQAMACYWFSQDSLQLRAQHNDRERQRLNQPNLSIFSKILAAKNTLPHTHSSHCLQTIIKFFSCCIWLFQVFSSILTPKTFVHQKSDVLEKGYWLLRPFRRHQVIYQLEATIANQSRGGWKTSRVDLCCAWFMLHFFPPQEWMVFY